MGGKEVPRKYSTRRRVVHNQHDESFAIEQTNRYKEFGIDGWPEYTQSIVLYPNTPSHIRQSQSDNYISAQEKALDFRRTTKTDAEIDVIINKAVNFI